MMKTLEQNMKEMKDLAILLVPYTCPIVQNDNDIACLKQRDLIVDGYHIIAHFTRQDYQGVYIDIITISARYMPFLPMSVLCKIARKFFGTQGLVFGEFMRIGRKMYSWMVSYQQDGEPLQLGHPFYQDGPEESYNGLEFRRINKVPFNQ